MSDHPPTDDQTVPGPQRDDPLVGADLLPEVEAPSPGFLLQLFVVPGLIVLVIFSVWLVASWLVHRSRMDPESLIQGLESSSVARWQRASELADILRNERYQEFRSSSAAAAKLAAILDRELDAAADGQTDHETTTLRYFLCRALGEFRVAEGLDTLVKAATTNRDPEAQIVRRGAVEAIAVRASNLAQLDPPQILDDPQFEAAMVRLASDEDDLVRSETAYALGRVGTPAALARLEALVQDAHADTRYNAAVALAQHGRAEAVDTLAEMLDLDETASVLKEQNDRDRLYKRALVMTSALDAAEKLAGENPQADMSAVVDVLQRLVSTDASELEQAKIHPHVVRRAQQVLALIQRRAGDGAAEPSR